MVARFTGWPDRAEQHGQALPLLVGLVALALALCLLVGRMGAEAADRAQAQTAADAAALAGAGAGERPARAAAAANGATVLSYVEVDGGAWVEVTVGRARATASARRSGAGEDRRLGCPGWRRGGGSAGWFDGSTPGPSSRSRCSST